MSDGQQRDREPEPMIHIRRPTERGHLMFCGLSGIAQPWVDMDDATNANCQKCWFAALREKAPIAIDGRTPEPTKALTFADEIAKACALVRDVLVDKHTDYGQSGLRVPALAPWLSPLEGLLTRQSDKYARIGQLLKNEAKVKDESLLDTARDQAGYAILIYLAVKAQVENVE